MNKNFPAQVPDGLEIGLGRVWDNLQKNSEFPLNLMVAVTERCNFTCSHCYVPPSDGTSELSSSEFETLFDELSEIGILILTFTGGEPSIREDLESIVEAATSRNFAVKLKTNGSLLTPSRIEALVGAGLSEAHVSIYSDLKSVHDNFAGVEGAWQQSVSVLEQFQRAGVNVMVASNIMALNADRIGHLLDFCQRKGFGYIFDPRVNSTDDKRVLGPSLRPTEKQLKRILEDGRLFDAAGFAKKELRNPGDPMCSAGTGNAYISSTGEVRLCAFLPMQLGNIREASFEKIWKESRVRQRFVDLRWRDTETCSGCDLSFACSRCPGASLTEMGSLTQISPGDCLVARARAIACARSGKSSK